MLVVSNTSPLSNLAIVDRLALLHQRYGSVLMPGMVEKELAALSHAQARQRISQAISSGWLLVKREPNIQATALSYARRIDPGEAEAIALAEYIHADKLLVDDRLGRELARERGVPVTGILGELLYAKKQGSICSVTEVMEELKSQARFFIRADLFALIQREAGEG